MSDDIPHPDQPPMPADPFTPADLGYTAMVSELHGLQRNGAGLLEAAILTAAHISILGMIQQASPEGQQ